MGWSKAKNVHAISRFREEISWNQFKLLHTITKFEKTLKYTFLFFLLRNAPFFNIVVGKKQRNVIVFTKFSFCGKKFVKLQNHNMQHFRFLGCSGGSRAAKIASSNTFFNPFCKIRTKKAKIKAWSHIKQIGIFTK